LAPKQDGGVRVDDAPIEKKPREGRATVPASQTRECGRSENDMKKKVTNKSTDQAKVATNAADTANAASGTSIRREKMKAKVSTKGIQKSKDPVDDIRIVTSWRLLRLSPEVLAGGFLEISVRLADGMRCKLGVNCLMLLGNQEQWCCLMGNCGGMIFDKFSQIRMPEKLADFLNTFASHSLCALYLAKLDHSELIGTLVTMSDKLYEIYCDRETGDRNDPVTQKTLTAASQSLLATCPLNGLDFHQEKIEIDYDDSVRGLLCRIQRYADLLSELVSSLRELMRESEAIRDLITTHVDIVADKIKMLHEFCASLAMLDAMFYKVIIFEGKQE